MKFKEMEKEREHKKIRREIKRNDEHCGDCPYLKRYGKEYDLTARCSLLEKDLFWHDYWIAECDEYKGLPKGD